MKPIIFMTFLLAIFSGQSHSLQNSSGWCPYIGLGEGWSQVNPSIEVTGDFKQTSRNQYSSLFSQFFFGIEKELTEKRFVGGRIFLNQNWLNRSDATWHTISTGGALSTTKVEFQQKDALGLSAESGLYVTDKTKIYGALDIVYAAFSLEQYTKIGESVVGLGEPVTRRLFGAGPRIGVRTSLTSSLDFYLESSYIFYESFNNTYAAGNSSIKRSISPQTLNVGIGVLYSF
jgi:hypothetical protein